MNRESALKNSIKDFVSKIVVFKNTTRFIILELGHKKAFISNWISVREKILAKQFEINQKPTQEKKFVSKLQHVCK